MKSFTSKKVMKTGRKSEQKRSLFYFKWSKCQFKTMCTSECLQVSSHRYMQWRNCCHKKKLWRNLTGKACYNCFIISIKRFDVVMLLQKNLNCPNLHYLNPNAIVKCRIPKRQFNFVQNQVMNGVVMSFLDLLSLLYHNIVDRRGCNIIGCPCIWLTIRCKNIVVYN